MRYVPRGRHFEEFTVGETFTTTARTVTEGEAAVRNQRTEAVCRADWTALMARRR
jgi:acyl dehydratase